MQNKMKLSENCFGHTKIFHFLEGAALARDCTVQGSGLARDFSAIHGVDLTRGQV